MGYIFLYIIKKNSCFFNNFSNNLDQTYLLKKRIKSNPITNMKKKHVLFKKLNNLFALLSNSMLFPVIQKKEKKRKRNSSLKKRSPSLK